MAVIGGRWFPAGGARGGARAGRAVGHAGHARHGHDTHDTQGRQSSSALRGLGRSASRCRASRRKAMGAGGAYKAGTISSLGGSWGMAIFWAGIDSPGRAVLAVAGVLLTWATSPATRRDELGFASLGRWPFRGRQPRPRLAIPLGAPAHMDGHPHTPHWMGPSCACTHTCMACVVRRPGLCIPFSARGGGCGHGTGTCFRH